MKTQTLALFWAHKLVTAGILAVGTFFNVAALIVGMDWVASTFFTLRGEIVLTTWFFLAFLLGVAVEFAVPLQQRWLRIPRRVITIYMLMLTLAHGVNNILLDNAATYVKIFSGPLYTYPALIVLGGMTIFVATLPAPAQWTSAHS